MTRTTQSRSLSGIFSRAASVQHGGVKALNKIDGREWIRSLPRETEKHQEVIIRLLDIVEAEPAWRWLEIGCSLAAGQGDELSDIDAGVGLADELWPEAEEQLQTLIQGMRASTEVLI